MNDWEKFKAKFLTGAPVYFKYDFEDAVIRFDGKKSYFVKFKGKKEFLAKPESKLVFDAYLEHVEITQAEYDSF